MRELVAGGVYHVFARGNDRCRIYRDDEDYARYLLLFERVVRHRAWSCLAYCLMPNHLHLLVQTPEPDLPDGMQFVQSQYALMFNKRHGRRDHLFGARYGAKRVTTDPQLWMNVAYIAQNPVKAGLCRQAEDWRWSSHAATLRASAPAWMDDGALMEYFGSSGGEPRAVYRQFVQDHA